MPFLFKKIMRKLRNSGYLSEVITKSCKAYGLNQSAGVPRLFHGRRNGILEATKPPMSEDSPFYTIQFIIAINQPIVIHNDENRYLHIKQQITERYGKAIPLDCCRVLCCTQSTKA